MLWLCTTLAAGAAPVVLKASLPPSEFQAVVDAFNKTHPDIRVELTTPITVGTSDKFLVALVAGSGADVQYLGWYENINKFIDAGVFRSLTPFIKQDNAQHLVSDIPPVVIQRFSRDGRLMGVPEYLHMRAVGLNDTYRAEAGLAPPDPNWSWSDFRIYAKKLLKKDADGKVVMAGTTINPAWAVMQGWLGSTGVPLHKPGQPGVIDLQQPQIIDALKALQEISMEQRPYGGIGWGILGGHVAMQSHMASNYASIMNASEYTYDTVEVPISPAGKRAIVVNDSSVFITKSSKHPQAAWAFVKFFLSDEGQLAFMGQTGFQPARMSLVNDWKRIVQTRWTKISDDWFTPFINAYAYAQVTDYFTDSRVVTQYLQPAFAKILNDGAPVANTLNEMVPAANAFISARTGASQ